MWHSEHFRLYKWWNAAHDTRHKKIGAGNLGHLSNVYGKPSVKSKQNVVESTWTKGPLYGWVWWLSSHQLIYKESDLEGKREESTKGIVVTLFLGSAMLVCSRQSCRLWPQVSQGFWEQTKKSVTWPTGGRPTIVTGEEGATDGVGWSARVARLVLVVYCISIMNVVGCGRMSLL